MNRHYALWIVREGPTYWWLRFVRVPAWKRRVRLARVRAGGGT